MPLFKSKTFQFLLAIFIIATLALFIGKLASDQWVSLIQWISGYATIRGTSETITKRKKDEIETDLRSSSDTTLANIVVKRTEQ
jgi:predicted PurR-regulated permease PerM